MVLDNDTPDMCPGCSNCMQWIDSDSMERKILQTVPDGVGCGGMVYIAVCNLRRPKEVLAYTGTTDFD